MSRIASLACAIWAASVVAAAAFDLQAHRGGRGLAPENTLAAFRHALTLGVTTLETDLAITKDEVVVLSHDPRLNPDLVRGPDGQWLATPGPPIHELTLVELRRYDVGRLNPATRYGQQFPAQKPADGERFPTLTELYALGGAAVRYNIETKIDPTRPDETVEPETFVRLVVAAVRSAKRQRQTTIQSFDWRTLIAARRLAPEIETACLTIESSNMNTVAGKPSPWLGGLDLEAHGGSLPRLAKAAGCVAWSPFWRNVTPPAVAEAQALGLKVVPWTVNDPNEMARLIEQKVDGLITDYPDRGLALLAARGLKAR
ncbi:MAG TPA: glycerophosphodiester phosphodiesterase [Reyranella sp.]|nr:glycerophosphodiester phosphodiesterase [Reyranella sp.]